MDGLIPGRWYNQPGQNFIPAKTRMFNRPLDLRLQNKYYSLFTRYLTSDSMVAKQLTQPNSKNLYIKSRHPVCSKVPS